MKQKVIPILIVIAGFLFLRKIIQAIQSNFLLLLTIWNMVHIHVMKAVC